MWHVTSQGWILWTYAWVVGQRKAPRWFVRRNSPPLWFHCPPLAIIIVFYFHFLTLFFFNLRKDLWSGSCQEGRRSRSHSEVDARSLRQKYIAALYFSVLWMLEIWSMHRSQYKEKRSSVGWLTTESMSMSKIRGKYTQLAGKTT